MTALREPSPGSPQRRSSLAGLVARAIFVTRAFDRLYRIVDRARSELVAGLASDEVLDRFNDLAYASDRSYRPDESSFRASLFPWEEEVIDRFFPQPPAHILVGGAGGGRETLALAELGYRVTAFEPSSGLAESLAVRTRDMQGVAVFRARYEDLPYLEGTGGRERIRLEALPRVDAVLAGWGSFSHLRSHRLRVAALESLAGTTSGSILISFLGYEEGRAPTSLAGRLRRALPRREGRSSADVFSVHIGFYHRTSEREVEELAHAAGLEFEYRNFDLSDTNWPHVVLRRPSR